MNQKIFPLFLLVILASSIPVVSATTGGDTVPHNLLDIPKGIADALGISEFAAGLLTSVILLMVCLLPGIILTLKARGNQATVFLLILGMSILGFCVAVGWVAVWFYAVIALMIALMFGAKIKDMI